MLTLFAIMTLVLVAAVLGSHSRSASYWRVELRGSAD